MPPVTEVAKLCTMGKPTIRLEKGTHRGKGVIKVLFPYSVIINDQLKLYANRRYSKTMGSWYFWIDEFDLNTFYEHLKEYAYIDYSQVLKIKGEPTLKRSARKRAELREEQKRAILKVEELLQLKNYSKSTLKTYKGMLHEFFRYYIDRDPLDIDEEDIKNYLLYLIKDRNVAISTQNQAINAIKFYYEKVEKLERQTYYIERPMKPVKLPNTLSYEEVQSIFKTITNKKHLAMLTTIYSAGLRRSELLNLKTSDIISDKSKILIRGGKGRKDRLTLLSPKVLTLLRDYYKEYRPKVWLFEGAEVGSQYSPTSLQLVLKRAAKSAGISRRVTLHMLRHSFATHMMERGIDIRIIQRLLGHSSLKTTEIYTHVSDRLIDDLKTPMDYED